MALGDVMRVAIAERIQRTDELAEQYAEGMNNYLHMFAPRLEMVNTNTGEITNRDSANFSGSLTSRTVSGTAGSWNIALQDMTPDFTEDTISHPSSLTGQDLVQMTADTFFGPLAIDIQNVWGIETLRAQAYRAAGGTTRSATHRRTAQANRRKAEDQDKRRAENAEFRARRRMSPDELRRDDERRVKERLARNEDMNVRRQARRAAAMRREDPSMTDADIARREQGMDQAEREYYNRGGSVPASANRGGRRRR